MKKLIQFFSGGSPGASWGSLLLASLYLLIAGGGRFSIDRLIRK